MKWMIASDIHGSAYYCRKLLEKMKEEGADRLLLLGDILYHGPRNDLPEGYAPKEVISMLNPLKDIVVCVRGNCDAEVDQMVLDFSVSDEVKEVMFAEQRVLALHGHHMEKQCENRVLEGFVVLSGHTHIPHVFEKEGVCYINPGSVSIPKEESPHSYIIYENGVFHFMDLERDEYMKFSVKKRICEKIHKTEE